MKLKGMRISQNAANCNKFAQENQSVCQACHQDQAPRRGTPLRCSEREPDETSAYDMIPLMQNLASMASTVQKILKDIEKMRPGPTKRRLLLAYIVGNVAKQLPVVVANAIHAEYLGQK
jgi:hypothetical protein